MVRLNEINHGNFIADIMGLMLQVDQLYRVRLKKLSVTQ